MQLESVRALKAELAQEVIRPAVIRGLESGRMGIQSASLRRAQGPPPAAALGVAIDPETKDFKVAVRLQRRSLEQDDQLIAAIHARAKGEVDVRYIGRVVKLSGAPGPLWHRQRQRPLLLGASIAHENVTAGTLGAFCTHRQSGQVVMLSNNHVLANEGDANAGDPVLQPGPLDGGRAADRVGSLRDFVPLKPGGTNFVDAAIAGLDAGVQADRRTLRGLGGALAGMRGMDLEPEDAVMKVGRTSGATRGVVTAVEVDNVVVNYEIGAVSFDNQIEIQSVDAGVTFGARGDSGSVIVDDQFRAGGLLFAVSETGGRNGMGLTFANNIGTVMVALGLDLAI